MKYISIKSAFQYLPRTIKEWDITSVEIEQYFIDAIKIIGIPTAYERKGCLLPINNHRVLIPKDLKKIDIVAISEKVMPNSDVETITRSYSTDKTIQDGRKVTTNTEVITERAKEYPNQEQVDRIQHQGVINNYRLWEESTQFRNRLLLARLTSSTTVGHTPGCPNINCESKITYGLAPGYITTSVDNGTIYIGYYALAKDECGDYLVPEIPALLEAMAKYAAYKIAEGKLWDGVANARYLTETYKIEWSFAKQNAIAKYTLIFADPERLDMILNQDLHILRNDNAFDNQLRYL